MLLAQTPDMAFVPYLQALGSLGGLAILGYLVYKLPSMIAAINEAMSKERQADRDSRKLQLETHERTTDKVATAIKEQTTELRSAIQGVCRYKQP